MNNPSTYVPYPKGRTVAIIQARMGSSRLPGKVLLEIAGQPMLKWVVERTRRAHTIDQVVVATTFEPDDDPVAGFCAQQDYPFYRGSLHDVLDRYYQTAAVFEAELVVRITADCPLIDPQVIDLTVQGLCGAPQGSRERYTLLTPDLTPSPASPYPFDFAANRLPPPWPRTYPIGLDVEVCTFAALKRAWQETSLPHQREHVMPYLYENVANTEVLPRFRSLLINHFEDWGQMRWTVDTPADLELVRQIVARLEQRTDFSWEEVLAVFQHEPELGQLNAGIHHKNFREVDDRGV